MDGGVSLSRETDGRCVVMPAGEDFSSKDANTCFGALLNLGPDISSNAMKLEQANCAKIQK